MTWDIWLCLYTASSIYQYALAILFSSNLQPIRCIILNNVEFCADQFLDQNINHTHFFTFCTWHSMIAGKMKQIIKFLCCTVIRHSILYFQSD